MTRIHETIDKLRSCAPYIPWAWLRREFTDAVDAAEEIMLEQQKRIGESTLGGWKDLSSGVMEHKPMIDIKLKDRQSGYDAVGEYIRRYWEHNMTDTVIVSLATSYDGKKFETGNEVASPHNFEDIEFLYDWWEGEKFIKLFGIKSLTEIDIDGGIYTEGDEV